MEKLVSSLPLDQKVPDEFVFSPEQRQPSANTGEIVALPVIDLQRDRDEVREEVMRAGKQLGFFQVINHGVPDKVINEMLATCEEFFKMPTEDKAAYYSEDTNKSNRLFSSTMYEQGGAKYWRDCLRLVCYPVEETKEGWPERPEKLREVVEKFISLTRELAMELLRLICEGLGLKEDYFDGDLTGGQVVINVNHYPPCPDPSSTLGLPPHCDKNLITLLVQGTVNGLQVSHKGIWINVDPIPNAFVVNFGHQLEIITNGLLKSIEHRAVTNSAVSRTSIATFIMPSMDSHIAPAEALVNENNPPLYRPFCFRDFLSIYKSVGANRASVMEAFKI